MPTTSPLDDLTVPLPCHAEWVRMAGTERVRFCSQCRQHVYNLSELTRPEAEALVKAKEGRLCVRFFRRPDGTVLTRDCLAAVQAVHRRLAIALGLVVTFLFALLSWAGIGGDSQGVRTVEPFRTIMNWFNPAPVVMGECKPLPPPPPAPGGANPGGPQPPVEKPDAG